MMRGLSEWRLVRSTGVARAASAVAILVLLVAASLHAPGGEGAGGDGSGHWDDLGEDGRVWVPAAAPAATALPPPGLGDYHDEAETVAVLEALQDARPGLFSLRAVGTTAEGRTIWMMRVATSGLGEERPRLLFDAAHHGNEVIGAETLTRFLLDIHARYDGDADLRALLGEVVVDVVPMVNVDGVARVPQCGYYADCRKNANGVDLNRNYPDHWGGSGSSGSPSSPTYRGPAPLSEPESQAIAAVIDGEDYALHASFHSGTELILWPHGWTTSTPTEAPLYNALAGKLAAATGAGHGQASVALYLASGTTMDQSYTSAAAWRPLSFTPEIFAGPGNAFDWWPLFNPQDTNASIEPVTARWARLLWTLVEEAAGHHPARVRVISDNTLGPGIEEFVVDVEVAPERPLVAASLEFLPGNAPVTVVSENPVPVPPDGGSVSFQLRPQRAGVFDAALRLDGGPSGTRTLDVPLELVQVGLEVVLDADVMGTPYANRARVMLDAGPFTEVTGTLTFSLDPGRSLGEASVAVTPGAPATFDVPFHAQDLDHGTHRFVAGLVFTGTREGVSADGHAEATASFHVSRPQLAVDKRVPSEAALLDPFEVLVVLRNTGDRAALDVVVEETVPFGYTYWLRGGPVPVPTDPLGAPPPDDVRLGPDGALVLTWELGDFPPGAQRGIRYGLLPFLPGGSVLPTNGTYGGAFPSGTVEYRFAASPMQTVG